MVAAESRMRLALDDLFSVTYEELRRLTSSVKRGDPSCTLNPTALVNEAWLKLAKSPALGAESPLYFKRIAARAMRQLLIESGEVRGSRRQVGSREVARRGPAAEISGTLRIQGKRLQHFGAAAAKVSGETQLRSAGRQRGHKRVIAAGTILVRTTSRLQRALKREIGEVRPSSNDHIAGAIEPNSIGLVGAAATVKVAKVGPQTFAT